MIGRRYGYLADSTCNESESFKALQLLLVTLATVPVQVLYSTVLRPAATCYDVRSIKDYSYPVISLLLI